MQVSYVDLIGWKKMLDFVARPPRLRQYNTTSSGLNYNSHHAALLVITLPAPENLIGCMLPLIVMYAAGMHGTSSSSNCRVSIAEKSPPNSHGKISWKKNAYVRTISH
jgi:hypothetical protein